MPTIDNKVLLKFILAEWEAKKREYDAVLNSPFPPFSAPVQVKGGTQNARWRKHYSRA